MTTCCFYPGNFNFFKFCSQEFPNSVQQAWHINPPSNYHPAGANLWQMYSHLTTDANDYNPPSLLPTLASDHCKGSSHIKVYKAKKEVCQYLMYIQPIYFRTVDILCFTSNCEATSNKVHLAQQALTSRRSSHTCWHRCSYPTVSTSNFPWLPPSKWNPVSKIMWQPTQDLHPHSMAVTHWSAQAPKQTEEGGGAKGHPPLVKAKGGTANQNEGNQTPPPHWPDHEEA